MPLCLGKVITLKFAFPLLAPLLSAAVFSHSSHPFLCSDACQTDPCHHTPVQHTLLRKQEGSASVKGNWPFQRAVCRGGGMAVGVQARRTQAAFLSPPIPLLLPRCTSFPALHSRLGWQEMRWSSHSSHQGRCFPKLFHQAREGATWDLCSFCKCFPGNTIKTYLAWSHTVS